MSLIPFEFVTSDNRYRVKSYGNGWAYEITENHEGVDNVEGTTPPRSLWVQDSDADAIREVTEDFEFTDVLDDYMVYGQ